jgi:hypothetical protein
MIIPFPGAGRPDRSELSPAEVKTIVEDCVLSVEDHCARPHPEFDLGITAGINHFLATIQPDTELTLDAVVAFICDLIDEQAQYALIASSTIQGTPFLRTAYPLGFIAGWMYAACESGKLLEIPADTAFARRITFLTHRLAVLGSISEEGR